MCAAFFRHGGLLSFTLDSVFHLARMMLTLGYYLSLFSATRSFFILWEDFYLLFDFVSFLTAYFSQLGAPLEALGRAAADLKLRKPTYIGESSNCIHVLYCLPFFLIIYVSSDNIMNF